MITKHDAGDPTEKMELQVQKFSRIKVGTTSLDNAKELKLGRSNKYLDKHDTVIDNITPYSSECNDRAERSTSIILEKAITILAN